MLCLGCGSNLKEMRQQLEHDRQVQQALREPRDPDIVDLKTFYRNVPFLNLDDRRDPNPEGINVTLYAISANTKKGAYADGVLRFKLYALESMTDDSSQWELVQSWEYTPEQALPYRVTRKTIMGWPYSFHLDWGDADVYGKQIRLVPEFVRYDGNVVRGSAKDLKVPPRKNQAPYSDAES